MAALLTSASSLRRVVSILLEIFEDYDRLDGMTEFAPYVPAILASDHRGSSRD